MRNPTLFSWGIVLMLPIVAWAGTSAYRSYRLNVDCVGYLKQAADANTLELAADRLDKALIGYRASRRPVSGTTAIAFPQPAEDVGFWWENLQQARAELDRAMANPNASQLEQSNVLMKLRESLTDSGDKGTQVTVPPGLSQFPHNVAFACWVAIGAVAAFGGLAMCWAAWE